MQPVAPEAGWPSRSSAGRTLARARGSVEPYGHPPSEVLAPSDRSSRSRGERSVTPSRGSPSTDLVTRHGSGMPAGGLGGDRVGAPGPPGHTRHRPAGQLRWRQPESNLTNPATPEHQPPRCVRLPVAVRAVPIARGGHRQSTWLWCYHPRRRYWACWSMTSRSGCSVQAGSAIGCHSPARLVSTRSRSASST